MSAYSAPASPVILEIEIEECAWSSIEPDSLAQRCTDAAAEAVPSVTGVISLLFTDDRRMQALNAQFRGRDNPTNVLSFPAPPTPLSSALPSANQLAPLGDIALGWETCRQEAHDKSIAIADHAAHLLVHGLLHLVGYDHQTEQDASVMEDIEVQVLATLGIANPYQDAGDSSL